MESVETRRQFDFTTKFRVLPKNFGEYGGEKVFDVEEIVVATRSLPFEDYIQCRKHHLTFSVFWNDSWFADLLVIARRFGVEPSEWLNVVLGTMEADSGPMGEFLRSFVDETKGELFDTRDACVNFYSRPTEFERLRRGEIGDNLMYKYRAIASFLLWKEVARLAVDVTEHLIRTRGAADRIRDFDRLWRDVGHYVEGKHATGTDIDELTRPVRVAMHYDIDAWLRGEAPLDPSPFHLPESATFQFELSADGARELAGALKVWTSATIGLSKLVTRVKVSAQVRSCTRIDGQQSHTRSQRRHVG